MSPTSTDFQIRPATWAADEPALSAIRATVFIDEQRVPADLEWDGEDDAATHWLALADAQPVGCVRLLRNGHIGRMAVLRNYRGRGIGAALLEAVIAHAQSLGLRELYLHAQTHALAFYDKQGFVAEGPEFMDAGIPHRTMRRVLRTRRVLGRDHGKFSVTRRREAVLDIAQQTRRQLRILSDNLDPAIYGHSEFASAVSQFVRAYRNAEIRILIADSRDLSPTQHALLALQRRLSSAIQIRRIGAITESIDENYVIADGCALLCYSTLEQDICWSDYNNVPLANDYTSRFDELWQHAAEDPNLRLLHI